MNKNRKLFVNILLYSIKAVLGIVFPLITFPYVSSVLGVENYGKVSFANSITSYFIFFAALGITTYAVREGAKFKNDKEKLSKFATELLIINLVSSLIAYIGILIICSIPFFSKYSLLIFINSITIICTTIGMEWVYNIKEEFGFITLRYIIVHILSLAFLFAFVKTEKDYYFYAIYIVLSSCGSSLINIFVLKKHINIFKKRKLEFKRHIKPLFLIFSISIAATILQNLDSTMLGFIKGDNEVGIYTSGIKIYQVISTINASISIVIFSRSSYLIEYDENNKINEKFGKFIEKICYIMILIAAPLTIGLASISKNLINVLLAPEYSGAGIILMITSFNILNAAYNRVFGHQVLVVSKHEGHYSISMIISVVIDGVLNLILLPKFGALGAAISTVVACLCANMYIYFIARKYLSIDKIFFKSLKYILLSLPFIVISLITNYIINNQMLALIIIILICVIYYFLMLLILKDNNLFSFIKNLKKGEKGNVN